MEGFNGAGHQNEHETVHQAYYQPQGGEQQPPQSSQQYYQQQYQAQYIDHTQGTGEWQQHHQADSQQQHGDGHEYHQHQQYYPDQQVDSNGHEYGREQNLQLQPLEQAQHTYQSGAIDNQSDGHLLLPGESHRPEHHRITSVGSADDPWYAKSPPVAANSKFDWDKEEQDAPGPVEVSPEFAGEAQVHHGQIDPFPSDSHQPIGGHLGQHATSQAALPSPAYYPPYEANEAVDSHATVAYESSDSQGVGEAAATAYTQEGSAAYPGFQHGQYEQAYPSEQEKMVTEQQQLEVKVGHEEHAAMQYTGGHEQPQKDAMSRTGSSDGGVAFYPQQGAALYYPPQHDQQHEHRQYEPVEPSKQQHLSPPRVDGGSWDTHEAHTSQVHSHIHGQQVADAQHGDTDMIPLCSRCGPYWSAKINRLIVGIQTLERDLDALRKADADEKAILLEENARLKIEASSAAQRLNLLRGEAEAVVTSGGEGNRNQTSGHEHSGGDEEVEAMRQKLAELQELTGLQSQEVLRSREQIIAVEKCIQEMVYQIQDQDQELQRYEQHIAEMTKSTPPASAPALGSSSGRRWSGE
jgi:hypothetical protein